MLNGQLWGGPEHGNWVSANVPNFRCFVETRLYLDGGYKVPSVSTIDGTYNWNAEKERFDWDGPGADGDTIERLRLR